VQINSFGITIGYPDEVIFNFSSRKSKIVLRIHGRSSVAVSRVLLLVTESLSRLLRGHILECLISLWVIEVESLEMVAWLSKWRRVDFLPTETTRPCCWLVYIRCSLRDCMLQIPSILVQSYALQSWADLYNPYSFWESMTSKERRWSRSSMMALSRTHIATYSNQHNGIGWLFTSSWISII